jgi:hypothetical protein
VEFAYQFTVNGAANFVVDAQYVFRVNGGLCRGWAFRAPRLISPFIAPLSTWCLQNRRAASAVFLTKLSRFREARKMVDYCCAN